MKDVRFYKTKKGIILNKSNRQNDSFSKALKIRVAALLAVCAYLFS